jgi:RNA polymerase sigma-70 factor (ECF subfamily)
VARTGFAEMERFELEDLELIARMRSGDLRALSRLYRRYGGIVYRLALKILDHSQEAEDLTQEVFLTFWRKPNVDSQQGKLVVYLLTMTRSQAINRIRQTQSYQQRLQRWHQQLPNHGQTAPHRPMEHAALRELSEQVSESLQALSSEQRQVLELAYYHGLSQLEISTQLQLPLGTVKTHSRRGLLKLRQLLKDWRS